MYIKLLTAVVIGLIIFGSASLSLVLITVSNKEEVEIVDKAMINYLCGYMMLSQVIYASYIAYGIDMIITHINSDVSFIVGLFLEFIISTLVVRKNVSIYKEIIVKKWGDSDIFEKYSTLHFCVYSIEYYTIYIVMYLLFYYDYI